MAERSRWRADAGSVIDVIVKALNEDFQRTPNGFRCETRRAGSLGHGTAVPGNHDIDLVIYSKDVSASKIVKARLGDHLTALDTFLKRKFPDGQYQHTLTTQHSVQFDFTIDARNTLSVDLLISSNWRSRRRFCNFLQFSTRPNDRWKLTVCAAKWQVEFFKRQPNEVKEYIRRAKVWRNEQWPKDAPHGGEGRPSSYLMSLLVVRAYEDHQRNPHQTVTECLICLVQDNRKDVYWTNGPRGDPRDYPMFLDQHVPRVIDPANPANNVWESGVKGYQRGEKPSNYDRGDGNTDVLIRKISSIDLSQPIE